MATMTYMDAISRGMWEEMERDPDVFLMGEDIGTYGGAFKLTKGFQQHFGAERVIDSVLSESALIGAGVGAAIAGMRPVIEMQFADFVSYGFTQLVMNAAKIHYRWNLAVPLVVRLPSGGYIHGGPYHSASPEGWFFHVPGLKMVAPATAYDAKGLMTSAIRDNNPVLFVESKYLYRRAKGDVPESGYEVEIGRANVKRKGADVTVITYGSALHLCLEAAEKVAASEGIETGVVDLRTLSPLDTETIFREVRATGKALVVHEDHLTGGVGAEVAALLSEHVFRHLDAPVRRVAGLDAPVPFAPPLEEHCLPSPEKIVTAITELARY